MAPIRRSSRLSPKTARSTWRASTSSSAFSSIKASTAWSRAARRANPYPRTGGADAVEATVAEAEGRCPILRAPGATPRRPSTPPRAHEAADAAPRRLLLQRPSSLELREEWSSPNPTRSRTSLWSLTHPRANGLRAAKTSPSCISKTRRASPRWQATGDLDRMRHDRTLAGALPF